MKASEIKWEKEESKVILNLICSASIRGDIIAQIYDEGKKGIYLSVNSHIGIGRGEHYKNLVLAKASLKNRIKKLLKIFTEVTSEDS